MKKIVAFTLIVYLIIPILSFAEESPKAAFSFRNGVVFGMSRDQIIDCEGKVPVDENGDYLIYTEETAAGKDATILYDMSNNSRLASIGVIFNEDHTNSNIYIDDFENIDDSLTAKYGQPETDENYSWSNTQYKDDKQYYGLAISLGYLEITSTWKMNGIVIFHNLDGDNFEFSHVIIYKGPDAEIKTDTDGV